MPAEETREDEEVAVERALRALARRDHSASSLRAKLARAGLPESAQEAAVGRLAQAGYVDDGRYACERARRLADRGYGNEWIRADLERQGVDRETAEAAISPLEPERERALRAAVTAGGGVRVLRSLARRGFSEAALETVAAALIADDAPERVGYESSI